MRELADVTTLRERRELSCDKFASKCLADPRFAAWFPLKAVTRPGSRRQDGVFLEEYARCDRLRNSTIFYMRHRLNGKVGKSYGERNKEYRNTGMRVSLEMNPARKRKASC